jgi:hypothetical protein
MPRKPTDLGPQVSNTYIRTKSNARENYRIGTERFQKKSGQLSKQCVECHHAPTLHSNGLSRCKGRSCHCPMWVDPDPSVPIYKRDDYQVPVYDQQELVPERLDVN